MKKLVLLFAVLTLKSFGAFARATPNPFNEQLRLCTTNYLKTQRPLPTLPMRELTLEQKIDSLYPTLLEMCGHIGLESITTGDSRTRMQRADEARRTLRQSIKSYLTTGSRSKEEFVADLVNCSKEALNDPSIYIEAQQSFREQVSSVQTQILLACNAITDELVFNNDIRDRELIAKKVTKTIRKDIEAFVRESNQAQKALPKNNAQPDSSDSNEDSGGLI